MYKTGKLQLCLFRNHSGTSKWGRPLFSAGFRGSLFGRVLERRFDSISKNTGVYTPPPRLHEAHAKTFKPGLVWIHKADYERAEEYFANSFDMIRKVFGMHSEQLASGLFFLSVCFQKQGDIPKSIQTLEESLSIWEEIYKSDREHPEITHTRKNLADLCRLVNPQKSLKLYMEFIQIAKQNIHLYSLRDLSESLEIVGREFLSQRRFVEAKSFLLDLVHINELLFPNNVPSSEVSRGLYLLASVCRLLREPQVGLGYQQKAFEMMQNVGSKDENYVECLHSYALILIDCGDLQKALEFADEIFTFIQEKSFAAEFFFLGKIYESCGEFVKSENCRLKSLEIVQKFPNSKLSPCEICVCLGDLKMKQKDLEKATEYFLQALEFSKNSPNSITNFGLAHIYHKLAKANSSKEKSFEYYKLQIATLRKEPESLELALALYDIAIFERNFISGLPALKNGLIALQESLSIKKNILGVGSNLYWNSKSEIGIQYLRMGENVKALEIFQETVEWAEKKNLSQEEMIVLRDNAEYARELIREDEKKKIPKVVD
jgi:tetratricopeptide (TPR) repeat protein